MFGIVYIHSSYLMDGNNVFSKWVVDMSRVGAPIFLTLWAYFIEKSLLRREDKKSYIIKRFIGFVRVFLLWSTLYFFITVDWSNLTLPKLFTTYYSGYGWSGQYFFILLLQFSLLISVFRFLANNNTRLIISMVVFTVIVVIWSYELYPVSELMRKMGNRPFIFSSICVLGGIGLARIDTKFNPLLIITVILLPVEVYFTEKNGIELQAIVSPLKEWVAIFVVGGVMSLEGTFEMSSSFRNLFHWVGKHTMAVFVLNPLIIRLLSPVFESIRNMGLHFDNVLFPFILAILVFSICLGMSWVVQKTRVQRILF